MKELILIALGFVGGAAALWFIYVEKMRGRLEIVERQLKEANSIGMDLFSNIESAWFAAFGPVGLPPEAQDAPFNALWSFVGKDQEGMPR